MTYATITIDNSLGTAAPCGITSAEAGILNYEKLFQRDSNRWEFFRTGVRKFFAIAPETMG
jgi:hypothetical protein